MRDPQVAAIAALVIAGLCLLWSAAEIAGVRIANARLAHSLDAREKQLAPKLAEREQALALAARNRALLEQFAGINALEAAAEFEHLIGARYMKLVQWEFTGRGLRAVLEDASPDNRAYVEALGRSPWFERVNVTPSLRPDQIGLEIGISAKAGTEPVFIGTPAHAGNGS